MADIIGTSLLLSDNGSGGFLADVSVEIRFSAREVNEDFDYGVNVAVVRAKSGVVPVPMHSGLTAMQILVIPDTEVVGFLKTSGRRTIRPDGQASKTATLSLAIAADSVTAGEKLEALITVVPELAASVQRTADVIVP
jgi:hypothetical protein